MGPTAEVRVHPTQFPPVVRRELLLCLQRGRVSPKFHYDSLKQTRTWLELHEAYSPSRTDPNCFAIYDRGFEAAATVVRGKSVHLVGLGCGGGQKDTRLLSLLKRRVPDCRYTPVDVSTAMVLTARETALRVIPPEACFPLVCDLAACDDLPALLGADSPRLITFFGMIPNFEPRVILPRLASLVRSRDWLLFSANLAPGPDYETGVRRVLPLYDNQLTREWLLQLLWDLGVERKDGTLRFGIETDTRTRLKRIVAIFRFQRRREVRLDAETVEYERGDSIRLFFSYRYTPKLARSMLKRHGLKVESEWITASEQEGVFLVRKARP